MGETRWAGSAYEEEQAAAVQGVPLDPVVVDEGLEPAAGTAEARTVPVRTRPPGAAGEPVRPAPPRTAADLLAGAQQGRPRRASRGWRATARRVTFGAWAPPPGRREAAELADAAAVRARFNGPKTVVVANPKGGSAKTVTTLGLAATFGQIRGGNVLAWDNNETLGTLGIRVPGVPFPRTAVDLLEHVGVFERQAARRGDLAGLVRPQEAGNFHVLASDEDPRRASLIDAEAFRRLHEILTRYYEVLIVDTGNNPRSANFLGAIGVADALVIPTSWSADRVLQAARLVDQLHEMGRADLVARAVTVVSGTAGTQTTAGDVAAWREFFAQTSAVVEIPADRHLAGGGAVDRDQLGRATRRAYLAAAAAVARQFDAAAVAASHSREH